MTRQMARGTASLPSSQTSHGATMSDDNTDTPLPKPPRRGWYKGMPTPNAKGRGKGTPNRFSQRLVEDCSRHWKDHGYSSDRARVRRESGALSEGHDVARAPELLLSVSRPMAEMSDASSRPRLSRSRSEPEADRAHTPSGRCPADRRGAARGSRAKTKRTMTSASAELARRRAARSSLSEWARLNKFRTCAAPQLLMRQAGGGGARRDQKLMFFLPPGSAKTTYCNLWVPWYMSRGRRASRCSALRTQPRWLNGSRAASAAWCRSTAPRSGSHSATTVRP